MKYAEINSSTENNNLGSAMKINIAKYISKKNILIHLIGFLIGRVSILGSLSPFGLAYLSILPTDRLNKLFLLISISLGQISIGDYNLVLKYIASLMLLMMIKKLFSDNKKNIAKLSLSTAFSIFTVDTIINLYNGFLIYDFIIAVFESFIAFVLVILFSKALFFLEEPKEKRLLTNEQILSATVLFMLCITGIYDTTFFEFSIRNILIICIILIFAMKSGAVVGCTIGVIAGVIISITSGNSPLLIGVYGFSGLMAGVFKDLGKIGVILGFVLGNALTTIYANASTEILINLKDIAVGAVITSIIPMYIISNINNYFITPYTALINKDRNPERIKEIAIKKLNDFSDSFELLAATFNMISEKNININKEDISTIFDEVAERVCKTCTNNTLCWNKDFYNTYQVMFNMLEKLEQNGKLEKHDLPTVFKDKCVKQDQFINNTNFIFELFTQNLLWQKKLSESRTLIAQQLDGVSKVITELSEEINTNIVFRPDIEKQILIELIKNNFEPEEVMVIEDKYHRYEVNIAHRGCGSKRRCNTVITPVVSKIVGKHMVKQSLFCDSKDNSERCVISLREQKRFRLSWGTAKLSKNNQIVCGDNCSLIELGEGKTVVVLSDGMGNGRRASEYSSTAIGLLEKFLKSGFDKDLAIKLINSVLVLKSTVESFATLDLSIVDMFTGEVEFAKIGAASTFIKRPYKIEVVKSTSLPVGILDNVDIELTTKSLNDGDIIIMVSDGVLDSKKELIKKEEWIVEELEKTNITNPQALSEFLLARARENLGGEAEDDMLVVAVKIIESV